jgi:hypothetical protein
MKTVFDDPDLDTPKHCGDKDRWCIPQAVDHVISYPRLGVLMPYPESLHVRREPAPCGCQCDACFAVCELSAKNVDEAVKYAYDAWKDGKTIIDPKCGICRLDKVGY